MGKKYLNPNSKVGKLIERDGNFCQLCGDEFTVNNPPTKDHIYCRSWGTIDNRVKNIRLLCIACNRRRGNSR